MDQSLFSLGFSFLFCETRREDEPRASKSLPAAIAIVSRTWLGTLPTSYMTPLEGEWTEWGKDKVKVK